MSDTELIYMLRDELRQGFSLLSGDIRQTNSRLDQTNAKLDQTVERLDQTVERLDQTILQGKEFRAEVSAKLDGITTLLLRYDKDVVRLEDRVDKIEDRVDDLERKQRPA